MSKQWSGFKESSKLLFLQSIQFCCNFATSLHYVSESRWGLLNAMLLTAIAMEFCCQNFNLANSVNVNEIICSQRSSSLAVYKTVHAFHFVELFLASCSVILLAISIQRILLRHNFTRLTQLRFGSVMSSVDNSELEPQHRVNDSDRVGSGRVGRARTDPILWDSYHVALHAPLTRRSLFSQRNAREQQGKLDASEIGMHRVVTNCVDLWTA